MICFGREGHAPQEGERSTPLHTMLLMQNCVMVMKPAGITLRWYAVI